MPRITLVQLNVCTFCAQFFNKLFILATELKEPFPPLTDTLFSLSLLILTGLGVDTN